MASTHLQPHKVLEIIGDNGHAARARLDEGRGKGGGTGTGEDDLHGAAGSAAARNGTLGESHRDRAAGWQAGVLYRR